jgi:hypothetical protein
MSNENEFLSGPARGEQDSLAAYAGQIAANVGNLASRLRDGSFAAMLENTRLLARRNPVVFIAGGVALGFVLTRLLKASADRSAMESMRDVDYFRDGGERAYATGSERTHSKPSSNGS